MLRAWDSSSQNRDGFNASHDERVIGILTTGPKPIFLQCDN
ncbi:hypothetical protein PDR5_43920 [Pseudomonas sp. DR 5-09]|nr:hypothetical protein PDR5_43920 [Pseudomonas sp. DR 5-09]